MLEYNEIYKIIMELICRFKAAGYMCVRLCVGWCYAVYRSSRISSAPQRTIFDINLEVLRSRQNLP